VPVDATTAALAGCVIGVAVGVPLGVLVTRRAKDRRPPVVVPPPVQPGPAATTSGDLPPGVAEVLSALLSGSVVVDDGEAVRWASAAVHAWGLVRDGRLVDEDTLRAVRAVRAGAEVHSFDLEPRRRRGGPRVVLAVQVARLGTDLTLVLADDRSEVARVDDVRRDFVANVSHELKTPAGALSLLAEAVEGAAEDPEAVLRFAARMQHESARLSSMVNELIELSRLQNDDVGPHVETLDVDEVVAEALDSVRTAALAKQIDLRCAGERGLQMEAVRSQLITALRNLLENAVAYSPERTRVVVTAQRLGTTGLGPAGGEDGDLVELSVADQGIGISAADQERIFERFYRVDPARSRETGGTGLGLSIVKHVCVNHGGEVTVWSTEAAGSTFALRLPQWQDRADAVPAPGDTQQGRPAEVPDVQQSVGEVVT
jgi:two-component system, OmpR family, sensor histidine kinase SenX3